jgi:5-methyltetrahydropteroyltriglutamate--homocysteine methyltransferase
MLNATRDKKLATAMVGSFPKPAWFTESLRGRPFKIAMGDSLYREQYVDAVACYVNEQERAGLDILTDGDTRFDLEVGGRSWFFYVITKCRKPTIRPP